VNDQEITASLAASHIAVVATIGRNGTPQLTPNWYRYDGQVLTLITRNDRLKYRNLQRDNRISVCIYDPPVASDYVVISGTATWNDQGILGRGPSDHRTLSGTERGRRVSRALANRAAGAHHGDPGAHGDAGGWETIGLRVPCSCIRSGKMELAQQLLAIERNLWTNDAVFYTSNLVEEALLVFPDTDVITRGAAVDAILTENAEGRRWAAVEFDHIRSVPLADDAHVLTYKVVARWAHEASTRLALASSIYIKRHGVWKLVFHQQTPIPCGSLACEA
jgi:hypothetical protein